ncbi:MAG: SLBB domain-containing protein [Ignavibacteriaceae bacterium]
MSQKHFIVLIILCTISHAFGQQLPNYKERMFGDSLAQAINNQLEPLSSSATEGAISPDEYKVGPGDKFFLSISGVTEITNTLLIDQEGKLYIPKVGGINLKNNSLAKAKQKIRDAILKYYKDVDIFISLVDFRKIKVSLTGDVVKQSIFILSANSRLIDLISASKGFNTTSNIRNIKIVSRDSTVKSYDFLAFLRFGEYKNNPILVEGDVVIVSKVDKIVQITGEVIYPAVYEYREGESVLDLIKLAGGFTYKARKDSIELVKFVDSGEEQKSYYYSYDQLKHNDVTVHNKDNIMVRQIPEYLIDYFVKIEGFVKYPGYYRITKDSTTLIDVIEQAGGFLDEASLTEASVQRKMEVDEVDPEYERLKLIPTDKMTEDEYDYFKAKSRQSTGTVIVDFIKLFKDRDFRENIILRRNDIINIPQKKDYIIMLGQFVNPGKIIYDSTYTVNEYIKLAGGFGWRAMEGDVRIIKAKTGEWIDADEDVKLQPGDTIWAPEEPPGPKFWTVFTDVLSVVAQVAAILAAAAAVIIATR